MTDEIRLNIGAGRKNLPGFTPIDRKLGKEAYPLDYPDDSVDEIRASHILEHFGFDDARKALAEWVRVLKPGGRIRIAVPDVDKICGECHNDPLWLRYLFGGQQHDDDFHRSGWTRDTLTQAMQDAGIVSIAPWRSDNGDCASLPVSLNLEGVKQRSVQPVNNERHNLKICAVISVPRVGWNTHWGYVYEALAPWRIPVKKFQGAFWGHGMQELLESSESPDLVLTLDYDTVFESADFNTMLHQICQNPHIDALAAMQARRRSSMPLCTVRNEDGETMGGLDVTAGVPFKAHTAHFGFTLLRVEALRKVPKPWFFGLPNARGEWKNVQPKDVAGVDTPWSRMRDQLAPDVPGHLRIDEDIWFWKQWARAGNSLYVSSDVRIGHLEEQVSWFDSNMQVHRTAAATWSQDRQSHELRLDSGNTDFAGVEEQATPVEMSA